MQQTSTGSYNIVGNQIRALRKKCKLRQTDVLEMLENMGIKLTAPALSKIECAKRGVSDIELLAFAKIFGVNIEALFPTN